MGSVCIDRQLRRQCIRGRRFLEERLYKPRLANARYAREPHGTPRTSQNATHLPQTVNERNLVLGILRVDNAQFFVGKKRRSSPARVCPCSKRLPAVKRATQP